MAEEAKKRTLERLTEDKDGTMMDEDKSSVFEPRDYFRTGKLITLVVENPSRAASEVVEDMVERGSPLVPTTANAYLASEFNCDTQAIRNGKMTSVYAIQFYHVWAFD